MPDVNKDIEYEAAKASAMMTGHEELDAAVTAFLNSLAKIAGPDVLRGGLTELAESVGAFASACVNIGGELIQHQLVAELNKRKGGE